MKNVMLNVSRIFSVVFIAGLMFVSVSCDDDDVDCSKNETEAIALSLQIMDADCEEIDALGDRLISLVKRSKSCGFVQELIDENEAASFSELLEMLEDDIAEYKAEACTPA